MPWGMVFLKQMLQKMPFSETVRNCEHLPLSGSSPEVILESFIPSIWCGANRFMHTEQTMLDLALGNIFGWKRIPTQDASKHFSLSLTSLPISR